MDPFIEDSDHINTDLTIRTLSVRSRARLLDTKMAIDLEFQAFVAVFEEYDSISEINLKRDDLLLDFARYLERKVNATPLTKV